MLAKKFQRKMPQETAFIFKDPKDANEFYQYINKKFKLNHKNVGVNTAFQLGGDTFYLSYQEAERKDETANVGLVVLDEILEQKSGITLFENAYTSRKGHWYIIITVYDKNIKNCLKDNHSMKTKIIQYLKNLKQEYLKTHNYEELLFTKKS